MEKTVMASGMDFADEPGSRKFGVVIFDDEKEPGAAWSSVNGSKAKRVEGMNQLATDTIWWSNMGYESFNRSTEAWRNPWMRADGFLVTKLKDVLLEWGLDPVETAASYAVTFCSSLFQRVMIKTFQIAKECDPSARMTSFFKGDTLRADVRRFLPRAEYPKGTAASFMKSGQAYAEFTRTSVRAIRGAKTVMLRRPRVGYAVEMLTTPVPVGQFDFVGKRELRDMSMGDKVAWIRGLDRPLMAEVTVDSMNGDVAHIFGFGNSTDKGNRIARSWVPHNEFLTMSSFSELTVVNAYIGKSYSLLSLDLPGPVKNFLWDRDVDNSWTSGVIAETIWRAASLPEEKVQGAKRQPDEERAHTSWRGAWLKAADRNSMFLSAMKLTDLGYATMSYGLGWVSVLVTEDQMSDLMRDALTLGLIPRLHDIPDGMFSERNATEWGGDKKSKIHAHLLMTKQQQMLWNLDRLPLFEPGAQRTEFLKKLQNKQGKLAKT